MEDISVCRIVTDALAKGPKALPIVRQHNLHICTRVLMDIRPMRLGHQGQKIQSADLHRDIFHTVTMRLKLFRIKVRSSLSMDRESARASLEKKMKSTEVERLRFLVDIIALIDYLFRSEVVLESSCLKDCFV